MMRFENLIHCSEMHLKMIVIWVDFSFQQDAVFSLTKLLYLWCCRAWCFPSSFFECNVIILVLVYIQLPYKSIFQFVIWVNLLVYHQAVIKQFSSSGYESSDVVVIWWSWNAETSTYGEAVQGHPCGEGRHFSVDNLIN